jgi:3'-5' exoribonuclease
MNNPSIPSALSNFAAVVVEAFPFRPIEENFPDAFVSDDPLLRDGPFDDVPFDIDPQPVAVESGAGSPSSPSSHLSASPGFLPDTLPPVLRIQSLSRLLEDDKIMNRAVLCHRTVSLCVDWVTQHVDTRLHRNGLVSIRPAANTRCADGAIRIQRLLPVTRPMPSFNLFDTLLPGWVKDPELVARAAALWGALPRALGHLVNAVLWDSDRFHRFVTGPSSLRGHHNDLSGNFRHSVEVAERARDLGVGCPQASTSLLIVGGLLHDVAKAAEYRYDRCGQRFLLSDRGQLVGHRDTLIEWLAVARETGGGVIDEATWLGLLHMLNAARGAPGWLGLREPRSLEAEFLSIADRLSGHEDLHRRCMPTEGMNGFGSYHPHLGHRTYVTREFRT